MKIFRITILFYFIATGLLPGASAQLYLPIQPALDSSAVNSVTMAAGSRFAASRWKQFWWGKHWRDEWLTPVQFPVFNMDTTAGGLTPLKRGGGHETKTLRLMGRNGREYVLRTVDKSLDVLIPPEFKGSFVNDLVNDQISTAHPYGPLVVAHLSGSIGIMHTNPIIVFVPDNPRLGEFKNDFANKLCLFEERPSGEEWDHTPLTRYADDIVNSEKLFTKLREDNKNQVDEEEFLKVRLFDMLINDWDRHEDQWVWTAQKHNGHTTYQAFARDRDQSFSKTDGVNLYLISRPWALRSVQNMNARINDVIGSNLSATFLDKKFTIELTSKDWQETIADVQQLMTDSVIQWSLRQMPDTIYAMSGDFLYRRLRQRRDNLQESGMKYYKILNREVTITGSDEQELFTINRTGGNTTEITLQSLNKRQQVKDTLYHRVFDDVTKEINLYGLGGNDQFIYTGLNRNRMVIRLIGGDGEDAYTDSSTANHHGKRSRIYDEQKHVLKSNKTFRYITADTAFTNYNHRSFKYDWSMPLIIPGYNPDDGFVIGGGIIYKKKEWNKKPFGWQQNFGGNYAAATGAYSLYYKGIFTHTFGKWDLDLDADYKAPAFVLNFYGAGNDSKLLTKEKAFYRVRAKSVFFNPAISRNWGRSSFKTGLLYNSVKVESAKDKFINLAAAFIDSSVFSTKYFAGANISYTINTSDNFKYPAKGIIYHADAAYLSNLKEGKKNFINLQSAFTFYYSPWKGITIAHRTGAAINSNGYEFYQANTLGGHDNLRGYWRTRFNGRTSFYQNTDLRIQLANLDGYVLRGKLGIYGFFDDGRVWVKNDQSNLLHTGYGGGVYFIPYSTLAINLSYAASNEVKVFTFRTGFLF